MGSSTSAIWSPLLTEEESAELAQTGHEVSYPAKTVVIRQGELSDFVLYLLKGHMKAISAATQAIVEIHGPGSLIGELSSLTGAPRSADVVTMAPTEALLVPGKVWRDFIGSHVRAACAHYASLASRFVDSDSARGESFTSSEHRVATAVLKLAASGVGARAPEGVVFQGITQLDVAALAKVSRESVAAVMRSLRESGTVSIGRERFTVHDLEAVRLLASRSGTFSPEGTV